MDWIFNLLFSFTASYFFAVVFDAPKKLFFPAGIVGAVGWMMGQTFGIVFDLPLVMVNFIGAFTLGIMSHIMARVYKEPSTIFLTPGIIPFVPGGMAYDATSSIILSDYFGAVNIIMEVIISAGSIAAGILFAEQFALLFIRNRRLLFNKNK
ncbi:membrane protein [Jeotgalicoccus coquinae]|nr:threonine/serine exporter family protein [Jeotgalicoccus coquinae]GGE09564.1 membrane protein [Jeotgalicoccus coquinae]